MSNPGLKKIVTFVFLTFALSAAPLSAIIAAGSLKVAGAVWVVFLAWCPGVAAIITQLLFHRSLRGLGWGWGKTKYQALGYLLPLAYTSVTYALVWLTGLGGVSDRLPTGTLRFLLILVLGPVFNMITAAIFHGSHNLYIQAVYDRVTVDTGVTAYVIGEFGAGLALMGLVVALIFWTKRSQIHAADGLLPSR